MATKANRKQAVKAAPKPVVPTTPPSDFEEFQRAYGDEWIRTIRTPAFRAAFQLLNVRKLDSITTLSNEQIEKNGREILSDLRGHLQLENDIFGLHEAKDFKFPYEEAEDYFSPEAIAEIEDLKTKLRDQQEKNRYVN